MFIKPVFASDVGVYRWPMPWCNMGGENQQHEEGKAVQNQREREKPKREESTQNMDKKLKEVYSESKQVKDGHTEKKAVGSSSSSGLVVRFSASRNSKSAISCHNRRRVAGIISIGYYSWRM